MTATLASPDEGRAVHVYRRRWLLLALFVAVIALNALPWLQYCVIEDVVMHYYGVTGALVKWTSLVYNVTAMLLVFPAAWMLDRYGLRSSVLVCAAGTSLGLWLKVAGCWQDAFWAALAGQAIVSCSTNFYISAATRFAAVWFPANEVSTALGVTFAGQLGGFGLGSALAPLTARSDWSDDDIFWGFLKLNLSMAVCGTVLLATVTGLFQDAPPLPPSPAQAFAQASANKASSAQSLASDQPLTASHGSDFLASMRRICKNLHFLLILISYTLIVAVFVAISTLLNRFVLQFFPTRVADAGWLATLMTLTGICGIIIFSIALDKTKWFKELSVTVYAGALATCVAYTVFLSRFSIDALYWATAGMGAFMSAFFVAGLELGAELTYPEPEGNPSSLINWMFQPFALIVTLVYEYLFDNWGADTANYFLCGLLVLGLAATLAIPRNYKRLLAETETKAAFASPKSPPSPTSPASLAVQPPPV